MIPDAIVDEVRNRADIVEIIGEVVALKRAGKDLRALCPFHQEKTPSFYVVPTKGFYKCFGCGESGDVFTFLMKREGLGFQDAVRKIAARVGVEIPESGGREEEPHRELYEAVAFAADFYRRMLRDEPAGERGRAYLRRRGIGSEAAERFQLGYAPAEWRALRDAASRHGISDEVLHAAGLIKTGDRGGEPYDRFRDRLIFPIPDLGGRIIAFGGRILGRAAEGTPKYLNSPETPIYQKGRGLYGVFWSKGAIRRAGSVLVVEGYMDYVSLAARGLEHIVAGLGTALTDEQAELIARYTRQAYLLYDSDAAGLRATFRTADVLLRARVHPLVVTLPPGEDPDSLVRRAGAEALAPYLADAVDVIDRKLRMLEERGYLQTIDGTRKALDRLLPTLRATTDRALRDIYVARVAERTGVRRETLERELSGAGSVRRTAGPREVARAARSPAVATARPGYAGERALLLLLLRDRARVEQAARDLSVEEITDPVHREIFEALVRAGRAGMTGNVGAAEADAALALDVGPAARERLEALLGDPEELIDGDAVYRDALNRIRAAELERRIDALDERIRAVEGSGHEETVRALTEEKRALVQELLKVGSPSGRRLARKAGRPQQRGPTTPG